MFVHLHVHTHYSLLDSTVKIPDLVSRTKELGMDAVAVTDHGNLFGAIEFQWTGPGKDVKPIYGVEVYVLPEGTARGTRNRPNHLVLLAENLDGYQNLLRLVSHAWLRGADEQGRPLTTYEDLETWREGIIALSGDMGGEIAQALLREDHDTAVAVARRLSALYGEDGFFLEVQRHEGITEANQVCDAMVALGEELGLPLVATNNVHYLKEGDHEAHAVLMCIGMDKRVDREIINKIPWTDLYLKSPEEMQALFSDLPEAIANTVRIADRCDVTIPTGTNYLPRFGVPEGMTEADYFAERARVGLAERFAEFDRVGKTYDADAYKARLEVEIEIIVSMKFPGYFLIVWDFINWAKDHDIPVGPGRGSGAGSLVAYSMRITDLDPIPYGLLFERFLNPERVSMPDFDIDFCQNRRGEVIDYVTQRYGEHNVAMIVTFGQLKAKAVVRDVARVLDFSYADADKLAKLVPDELNIKLQDAYDKEPRLREAVAEDAKVEYLYNIGLALERNNRNTGMHAAGVVISEKPLWEYVPIFLGASGEIVSQYAKNEVEAAGLVKFDFLGLKTLTVIDEALRLVNRPGQPNPLDFATVSLDHPAVYRMITEGDTTGVFQMESEGFQRLVKRLKPDCFEDIVATVALYRPGPLSSGMVDDFIDVKHQRKAAKYPHPLLEPVLKETYGVMVYQEQVMQSARVLAGFSLGGADILRRAMGKKKPKEMEKQSKLFVAGAVDNPEFVAGCPPKVAPADKANEIFDLIAGFAGYGFNKSHSAAYALLTFQTGYLKAKYPTEFYAALMTLDANNTTKVVRYINDARARGIRVLPPDVNASDESFSVSDGAVRFGLGAIKGLGGGPIEAIVEARQERPFDDLGDFCERVDLKRVSKRVLEALVGCGAFDSTMHGPDAHPTLREIGRQRAQMMAVLDVAVARGQKVQRDKEAGQSSLFGLFEASAPEVAAIQYPDDVRPWSDKFLLNTEKQKLGFYVSGHPLDRYKGEIGIYTSATTSSLSRLEHRADVKMAGVIAERRERPLKSGEGRMAFLQVEDHFGHVEVIVWAKTYPQVVEALETDDPVIVTGHVKVEEDDDGNKVHKVIADAIEPLESVRTASVTRVRVQLDVDEVDEDGIDTLARIVRDNPGDCVVEVVVGFTAARALVSLSGAQVAPSDELMNEVTDRFGPGRVRFL